MINEPEPETKTEPTIAPESEPQCESDQVCEPAPPSIAVGVLVKYEGIEEHPDHNPTTEGEPLLNMIIMRN